jgi:hypothetical protein
MNPETLNTLNEQMYRAMMLLFESITLIIGLASILFMVIALICAICGHFAETRPRAPRQIKSLPEPYAYDLLVALAGLDDSLEDSLNRRAAG